MGAVIAWAGLPRDQTPPRKRRGLTEIVADTIIGEHYSKPGYTGTWSAFTIKRLGRLEWQAWGPPGAHTVSTNLDTRCPAISFDGPPDVQPTYIMYDCRQVTHLIATASPLKSVRDFGWPPEGFAP